MLLGLSFIKKRMKKNVSLIKILIFRSYLFRISILDLLRNYLKNV